MWSDIAKTFATFPMQVMSCQSCYGSWSWERKEQFSTLSKRIKKLSPLLVAWRLQPKKASQIMNDLMNSQWTFFWIVILVNKDTSFFSIDIVSCSQSKHVYFTWLESHPSCYIQVNKWTSIFSMIFAVQHLALEVELDNLKRRSAQAQLLRKLRVSCTHSDPNFAPNPQKWRPLRTARQ